MMVRWSLEEVFVLVISRRSKCSWLVLSLRRVLYLRPCMKFGSGNL